MYKRTFVFCYLFLLTISSGLYSQIKQDYSNSIFSIPFPISQIGLPGKQILVHPCNGPDTLNITIQNTVTSVKLVWKKNSNPWDSVMMTNTGGYNWRGIFYTSGSGSYGYYIKFLDSLNRVVTAPPGAPGFYYSFVCGPDTIKPVITHTPIGNTPKVNWPVAVSATVIGDCGLDSVWVRWKINSGNFKQFKLLNTSGNTYTSIFNSTQSEINIGDTIRYRIIAQDISSYHNKDSTALYNFKVIQSVGINSNAGAVPEKYSLYQNYPNPFNPVTRINFDIPKQGVVSLKIYDILGREVKELVNETKSPGSYSVDFDASDFSSGTYFYRLESNGFSDVKRMILIK